MGKLEDELMIVHRNITLSCLQYVQGKADKIFMYCITEKHLSRFDVFFKIGENYSHVHKVNDYLSKDNEIDVSGKAQRKMLYEVHEDLAAFREIFNHYEQERPSEVWLIYDVKAGNLQWDYSYQNRYEKDENLIPEDEFEKWFEEVKTKNL